jgi:hypothetical protein
MDHMFIITSELFVHIYVVAKVVSIKVQLWTFLCNLGDFGHGCFNLFFMWKFSLWTT